MWPWWVKLKIPAEDFTDVTREIGEMMLEDVVDKVDKVVNMVMKIEDT